MMTETASKTIVVEREMPHPPEKIWRALTETSLIEQWLMKNDFEPVEGHRFQLRANPGPHWNGVADCEVVVVEPPHRLSYRWSASGEEAENGPRTVVTWTLTPIAGGTLLRLEHSGFRPQDEPFFNGASHGWVKIVTALERVTNGLD